MRVEIESLSFGGRGVARQDGKVLFVKGGIPNDVLDIKIIKDRGSYAEAVIEEIVVPSEERVAPPCPVFGTCGGCQHQDFSYAGQLREKENIMIDSLVRIGGFDGTSVEGIYPSPREYGYRTRVQLTAWFYSGAWHIGYFQEGTHRKVDVEACPIADLKIEQAIERLSHVLSSIEDPGYPLDKVIISSDGSHAYITLVARRGRAFASLSSLVKHLKRFPETEIVSTAGREEIEFISDIKGIRFLASPSVFTQSNPPVNEAMIETVLDWAELSGKETVLDLYSGTGNFSIPCARSAGSVTGVEVNKKAAAFARKNAELNGAENVEFHVMSCEDFLDRNAGGGERYDIVVLDPPREGAKGIIEPIVKLSPEKIIYVSCDPATLSRDLKKFCQQGYGLIKSKPFDMFPQTYHIESVSLLTKK